MTWRPALQAAAAAAVDAVGPVHLRALADRLAEGRPRAAITEAVPVPGFSDAAAAVLAAQEIDGVRDAETAAYLYGVADGHARHAAAVTIESVWSGPRVHGIPVRSTAQVLVHLVQRATAELLLMTYSAKPYEPLRQALAAAIRRGVEVTAIVETLQGAGSAMSGDEPAAAFHGLGVHLWHWPAGRRTERGAKMHAKIAVADRRELLVSSANLTQSGVDHNIEAGLVIRGGSAPRRAAEHIAALRSAGMLERL
ncbi:DISARM system phospholipase D-like protein DrmC [Actinoallomurus spadix]|uniref:PLD phosphodiesterase domain-containing protein n=1 Tax=Actinoallomurus spadix TaxID=79912 RepID=A0ABN0WI96_9ACTN|nr:DISARM system phospholipase D-like protein DrmC [Actinoallomurus spadix]MCO5989926.1 DISARM system phospholipase D-like protein DrmC [Actinoallomurus spadix]